MAIKLKFGHKAFNPNFWHVIKELKNENRRFITLIGGSSSGKSYSVAQAISIVASMLEGSNTLVLRKVSATIDDSIYKSFKESITNLGLDQFFTFQSKKIICSSGAVIIFKGLDDSEKIKGIESFKRVVMDELTEFDFEDYKQIRKRLRGVKGQQIIAMFNPVSKNSFVKQKIFDVQTKNVLSSNLLDAGSELGIHVDNKYTSVVEKWEGNLIQVDGVEYPSNFVVIKSTYLNNFWVVGSPCGEFGFNDIQVIADFEHDKKTDYDFYRIYALAEWGNLSKGGEAYKDFKVANNTTNKAYNKDLPLHISFDENVNPYLSLSVFQGEKKDAWQIDEFAMEHPKNTLLDVLKAFTDKYETNGNTLYLYGDRTSLKADAKLQKGINFFTIIEEYLRKKGFSVTRRLPNKNPSVALRIQFMNALFRGGVKGCSFAIDDSCIKTIDDFESVKEASDGTKDKKKIKHPVTKIVYEPYGHLSDVADYFICEYFKKEFIQFGGGRQGRRVMRR